MKFAISTLMSVPNLQIGPENIEVPDLFRQNKPGTFSRASMIPSINSFLAVGLISLPGMMTGQILSGVSPLIAVRYQIMVMCMIFGAAGLSTVCFLTMIRRTEHFREMH